MFKKTTYKLDKFKKICIIYGSFQKNLYKLLYKWEVFVMGVKKGKRICDILIATLMLISVYYFINSIYIEKQNREIQAIEKEQTEVMNKVENDKKVATQISTKNDYNKTKTNSLKDLDYYKNYYSNNDIVGTLKISGTKINTLLVQGSDNEYYLNHTISKKKSSVGSIYVDYRTNLDAKQINIYGHNSKAVKLMFNELEKYRSKDFYESHKTIELYDGTKTSIYEIFSVQIVTDDYEHMDVVPQNRKSHLEKLSNGLYETGIITNEEDDVLVLQTCTYTPKNSFIIINAKKVKEVKV